VSKKIIICQFERSQEPKVLLVGNRFRLRSTWQIQRFVAF